MATVQQETSLSKQLDKIVECQICSAVFVEPRILPCGHTHCLRCIEGRSEGKKSGQKMSCPLCTKEFIIPEQGFSGLLRNDIVDKLLQASSRVRGGPCEVCSQRRPAVVYCMECKQQLCGGCDAVHKALNSCRHHKTDQLKTCLNQNLGGDVNVASTDVKPTLVHIIPSNGKPVHAVTSVDSELFVLRNNTNHIDVYDAAFTLRRKLHVFEHASGIGHHWKADEFGNMAGCSKYKCIYVSDLADNVIRRVPVTGNTTPMKWTFSYRDLGLRGLSVTRVGNVLVAWHDALFDKDASYVHLYEYTTYGVQLRAIALQGIENPIHAVEMSSGQFMVSHKAPFNGVSVVGTDGRVLESYYETPGSGSGYLHAPWCLAADKDDNFLVAEHNGSRVLAVNSRSTFARDLHLHVEGGFNHIVSVSVDEAHGRIFIGENKGGRVFVFGNVLEHSR